MIKSRSMSEMPMLDVSDEARKIHKAQDKRS